MDDPWFRRWLWFGFFPIKWQGWAVIALFSVSEILLFLLSSSLDDNSALWWIAAMIGLGIFLGFYALAVWRMERDYGR